MVIGLWVVIDFGDDRDISVDLHASDVGGPVNRFRLTVALTLQSNPLQLVLVDSAKVADTRVILAFQPDERSLRPEHPTPLANLRLIGESFARQRCIHLHWRQSLGFDGPVHRDTVDAPVVLAASQLKNGQADRALLT
jgi:hypothetical protein